MLGKTGGEIPIRFSQFRIRIKEWLIRHQEKPRSSVGVSKVFVKQLRHAKDQPRKVGLLQYVRHACSGLTARHCVKFGVTKGKSFGPRIGESKKKFAIVVARNVSPIPFKYPSQIPLRYPLSSANTASVSTISSSLSIKEGIRNCKSGYHLCKGIWRDCKKRITKNLV